MNKDLISYYKDRAKEYDKVYQNPDEQEDLQKATRIFQNFYAKKTVLEIACGTGYWTHRIATTATSVHATDINESVIDIAKSKLVVDNITFEVGNMYDLKIEKKMEGLFGGFIWSHILLQDLDPLLEQFPYFLQSKASIGFIDSNQVKGTYHDRKKIASTDKQGNTYQARQLENGTEHLVLKNFPTQDFLFEKLSKIADHIHFIQLEFYWVVTCKLKF